MAEPILSVIIPVYNGAKYLGRMLDSILKQTFSDFELLVVDNNSTDGTPDLMQEYASRDGRICCLHHVKPGVSAARNEALGRIKGSFVIFLDADDWIDADYFETMLKAMDGVELVSAGYRAYFEKGEKKNLYYDCFYESPKGEIKEYTAPRMLQRLFEVTHYQGYVWNKCFCADLIAQAGLRFHEDISYNEDRLFVVEYLSHCHTARLLGVNKYHYVLHAGNAVSADMGEFPLEEEFTEIEAFWRMLPYLKDAEASRLARINMAERELLLFRRMIDPHGFARYRKSRFRYHARNFRKLQYRPKDKEEAYLSKKLIFYGWTGICYGKNEQ